ncbi:MAG: fluoride efflux transporter CrcB, partial [Actinobacteria bacterium]|nr:fluoride efflux transporter CrcB [Actinomycetota bacterium]
MNRLLVAVGGGIGGVVRYFLTATVIPSLAGNPEFPLGTFLVNISGAFLIGLVFGVSERGYLPTKGWSFLVVGILGGYTTFSTFTFEALDLFVHGQYQPLLLSFLTGPIGLIAVV